MPCPPHPASKVELRKKPAVGGGVRFQLQCLSCGRGVGHEVPIEKVKEPRKVKPWQRGKQPGARKRAYQERLRQPDWKVKVRVVLARDNFECRWCGELATTAGHLTYERFGKEKLSDLAASCTDCQKEEREQRITSHVLGTGT